MTDTSTGGPVPTEAFGSFERGIETRRAVLGSDYVANALGSGSPDPLQQYLTETAWGGVWSRDELPRRTRSMLTLALLTVLNRPHEIRMHTHGALRNGCTPTEIREVILHCAVYAGVPAAVDGMRVAEEVLAEHDGSEAPPA